MQTSLRLRRWVLVGSLALVPLVGACAGNDAKDNTTIASSSTSVTVKDFAFKPKEISIKVGDTVTWTNEDEFDHSIQIDSIKFAGPKFGPPAGQKTFAHRFDEAGTYPYICGVHNSMTGTVVVSN
jgi:plastocyanin